MTGLFAWWPDGPGLLLLTVLVGLGAGAVRGFAGFGFSALVVAALSSFVAPGPVVGAVLALECVASLIALRGVVGEVDRRWLRSLLWGNALCIPLGLAALASLPAHTLRVVVGGALLTGTLMLRLTNGRWSGETPRLRAVAGVASGLLNGLAASGGVAAALLMAATHPPAALLRATLIAYQLWIAAYALTWAWLLSHWPGQDRAVLLGADTLRWILVLAPTMLLGMRLGQRAYGRSSTGHFRRHVLTLLALVSGAGLADALLRG